MVDKSEQFSWLVRLGYAARGLTYILLGYLALQTTGQAEEGSSRVFAMLEDVPLGEPLLWAIAIGMLAYAVYKFLSAFANIYNRPDDTKGVMKRVGDAASGVAHSFLAYAAYEFAGAGQQSANGDGTQQRASELLGFGFGSVALGLIGLGFIVGAFMQAKKVVDLGFMKKLSGNAPGWVCHVGRGGHAARAVVFAIIGWSLVQGAWFSSSSHVKGLGEAITSLSDMGFLYTLVAVGLILFGIFSLVSARYRIIPDMSSGDLKPKFR